MEHIVNIVNIQYCGSLVDLSKETCTNLMLRSPLIHQRKRHNPPRAWRMDKHMQCLNEVGILFLICPVVYRLGVGLKGLWTEPFSSGVQSNCITPYETIQLVDRRKDLLWICCKSFWTAMHRSCYFSNT